MNMQKFMLIIREDLGKLSRLTDEQRFSNLPEQMKWIQAIADAGNYVTGEPLAISGRYVSKNEILSDGPFIESKEGVSGYDIITARNLDEAVAIAKKCPLVTRYGGVIEVRPVESVNDKP